MSAHGLGEDAAAQGLLELQLRAQPAAEGEPPPAPSARSAPIVAGLSAVALTVRSVVLAPAATAVGSAGSSVAQAATAVGSAGSSAAASVAAGGAQYGVQALSHFWTFFASADGRALLQTLGGIYVLVAAVHAYANWAPPNGIKLAGKEVFSLMLASAASGCATPADDWCAISEAMAIMQTCDTMSQVADGQFTVEELGCMAPGGYGNAHGCRIKF